MFVISTPHFLTLLRLYSAACAASLPETLRSYILSRPDLYHQVLTYEPVWLESLHRDLRETGLKLNISQLMDFLDEQVTNCGRRQASALYTSYPYLPFVTGKIFVERQCGQFGQTSRARRAAVCSLSCYRLCYLVFSQVPNPRWIT